MSVINSIPLIAAGDDGYRISRSVRLRSSASAYFNRTFTTPTNNKIWTWSGWVKRGALATGTLFAASSDVNNWFYLQYSSDQLAIAQADAGSVPLQANTTAVFRDPSAWYHVVCIFDSTQATGTNRLQLYVNGVLQSLSYTAGPLAQNTASRANIAVVHTMMRLSYTAANYFDGYLTEINFIDGQALTPSSFGETDTLTGVWKPKKYAGTYGTNGFYLNFSDNSSNTSTTIGKDYSGNGNNWTPNNISVTAGVTYDSMLDVPTPYADGGNGRGNYCVLNPLDGTGMTAAFYLDSANLNLNVNTNSGYRNVRSTISPENFKGYFEVALTTSPNEEIGFAYESILPSNTQYTSSGTFFINLNGDVYNGSTVVKSGCTPAHSSGDIIQVAFDFTGGARNVWFGRNGTWGSNSVGAGDPANGTNPVLTVSNIAQSSRLYFAVNSGAGTVTMAANFGQRPFSYTPPTGFIALNTQNLPTPTISNGANYMAATIFTGNGTSQSISNAVNGVSMQPDWVWYKARSQAYNNGVVDSVRGITNYLFPNLTNAEASASTVVTALNSNGFSVGSATSINENTTTYVAWQWKANGTGVTNTSGSITSTVSAGATQGFSVVTWTGTGANATVGHGLGVAPKMMILANRGTTHDTIVYHASLPSASYRLYLNLTNAQDSGAATSFNSLAPTSSVINLGSNLYTNGNGYQMVAYCFAEVAGYSKFGSYTGNGSSDGPFVYLGFRPRWVMIKRTDSTGYWQVLDTSRSTSNVENATLYPNVSNAEDTTNTNLDGLSNGFKIRGTPSTDFNTNGSTYIYAAFAENPTKFALAR